MKVINKALFAGMFLFSCLAFAGVVKAELLPVPVAEETATIENGTLVVKVMTETERYALPSVDVPAKDIPVVLAILRQGEGRYETDGPGTRGSWIFGLPMVRETPIVKIAVDLKNGRWSEEKRIASTPIKKVSWSMTGVLAVIVVAVAAVSLHNQRSGRGDRRLLWFYGKFLLLIMSGFVIAISINNIPTAPASVVVAVFICFVVIIDSLVLAFGKCAGVEGATALLGFSGGLGMGLVNSVQFIGFATFLAAVIGGSYLLAKTAKRLLWNSAPDSVKPTGSKCSRFSSK